MFAALAVKYGHKWSSYIGDEIEVQEEIEREWAVQLGKYNLMQIKKALDTVLDEFPDWPPTIGEFKAMCNVGDMSWRTDTDQKLLTNPTKPETVSSAMAEMRAMLK